MDKINPNRSTKSTMCGSNNNCQYGEPIILGEGKSFTHALYIYNIKPSIVQKCSCQCYVTSLGFY
ncbi:unnamed protein product [Schistosoma mattheei]|uniref:Uncharacterized protein n=1 Tax=Schistosoma mattheei TaxID=31246 RepID=A0A3P8GV95_9TREM|nr:unnamed protein product [Schistosoma mattheei]